MMQSKRVAGTQIWAWSDDIFCVPNRGLEDGRETTRSQFIENQYDFTDLSELQIKWQLVAPRE